ncbi:hypothetical protein NP493_600g01001 [Ridgeia piscesae]|uniref:Fucolectin tachylectin-4 pentraxin-1 domain-containing protein n=1 Tax=Ridgeia piscesae TaxID=27915 RepID=A0AAD9KV97_RIDPI|nr:hypothetical protein NP493_600g01001 [Ridgeia piscesae]
MLVDVSYAFSTNLADRSTACYSMPNGDTFAPDEMRYLPCRANATFKGRFVRITRLGASTTLILCEVQVHGVPETVTNIAKNRPATQSSIIGKAHASFAVDGNVDGLGVYGECSVTSESSNPWWKVDLGNIYRVDDVVVVIGGTHNDEFQYHEKRRISCPPGVTGSIVRIAWYDNEARKVSLAEVGVYGSYGHVLNHILIETLRNNGSTVTMCNEIDPPLKSNEMRRISCQRDAVGSIVRIRQQASVTGALALCEVEVYGTFGKKLHDFVIHVLRKHYDLRFTVCAIVGTSFKLGETKRIRCHSNVLGSSVKLQLTGASSRVLILCEVKVYGIYEGSFATLVIEAFEPNAPSVCAVVENPWLKRTPTYFCTPNTIGSKVRLKQKGQIYVCEVEVFGHCPYKKTDGIRNLARFKPTKLASTPDKEFKPHKAVNGLSQSMYKRGGCAATKGHLNGNWWKVDLEAVGCFKEIV